MIKDWIGKIYIKVHIVYIIWYCFNTKKESNLTYICICCFGELD